MADTSSARAWNRLKASKMSSVAEVRYPGWGPHNPIQSTLPRPLRKKKKKKTLIIFLHVISKAPISAIFSLELSPFISGRISSNKQKMSYTHSQSYRLFYRISSILHWKTDRWITSRLLYWESIFNVKYRKVKRPYSKSLFQLEIKWETLEASLLLLVSYFVSANQRKIIGSLTCCLIFLFPQTTETIFFVKVYFLKF